MSYPPLEDTIVAVASPPGGAARGIVRASGRDAWQCVSGRLVDGSRLTEAPVDRPAVFSSEFQIDGSSSALPCELFVWPNGRSYTGQPVVEIHTLGAPALLDAIVRTLCQHGARLAEPGEFTLRAFLSGRMDLTEAEAVLGVIDALGEDDLQTALVQLSGGLARPLHRLRDELVDLLAHLEAGFDFADEDLPFLNREKLERGIQSARSAVEAIAAQMKSRSAIGPAAKVALLGRPNAGKSRLFNALTGGQAIVSHVPGTTRDYLSATLEFDGLTCELIDTAGLESSEDAIAQLAQSATATQSRAAWIRIVCIDATQTPDAWDCEQIARHDSRQIVVWTKIDLANHADAAFAGDALRVSSATGQGLGVLRAAIRRAIESQSGRAYAVAATASRCRESLQAAAGFLEQAGVVVRQGQGEELAAEDLRAAVFELGKVVGAVYTDDILDLVFRKFCVGK